MFSFRSVLRGPKAAVRSRRPSARRSTKLGHAALFSLEPLEERRMLAFTTALVADLSGPGGSSPRLFAEMDETAYFVADYGLWKSDATESGTQLVKDLALEGRVSKLTVFDEAIYFSIDGSGSAASVWKSDGTTEGTQHVVDLPGPSPGSALVPAVREFVTAGGSLFFTVTGGSAPGLWKTDGTEAGTFLVRGFNDAHQPTGLTNVSGQLFFTAGDELHGRELWTSDGTAIGTALLRDVNPGADSMLASYGRTAMVAVGDDLYFRASDGIHGEELWKSDGTAAGTVMVADIRPGSQGSDLRNFSSAGEGIYFVADDGAHGDELWRSAGTSDSTALVKDLNPGAADSIGLGLSLTEMQGEYYFHATDGSTGDTGVQVWKTDGTAEGTTFLANAFTPVPDHGYFPELQMTSLGDVLVFTKFDPPQGYTLWRTEGTAESTTPLWSPQAEVKLTPPKALSNVGGALYFAATDFDHGEEPWISDGTSEGTRLLKDLNTKTSGYVEVIEALTVGAVTYIAAYNDQSGLWRTDGTQAGTHPVKSSEGLAVRYPSDMTEVNGIVYFTALDDAGNELWRTDGTDSGTWRVADIRPSPDSSYSARLTNVSGALYFWADDGVHGHELWKSDGTEAGTILIKDIRPGVGSSYFGDIVSSAGQALFFANDGTHGGELWRSDSTASGTVLVKDIRPGPTGSDGNVLLTAGGTAILRANDGTLGNRLWRTDGTEAGTKLIELNSGSAGRSPFGVVEYEGIIFFSVFDSAQGGQQIWKAPVGAGVAELVESLGGSVELVPVGDRLFVSKSDGQGTFLGVTDATVADIDYYTKVSAQKLVNSAGTLVFFGWQDVWTSDGTASGTEQAGTMPFVVGELMVHSKSDLTYFWEFGRNPQIVAPPVVARLFYNNSSFDQSPASTMDDNDAALAVDKLPYIPGNGQTTGENVSSYSKGINGLFIDLAPGHGPVTADDFIFRTGTSTDPASWTSAPAPLSINVRPGEGIAGHDRVEIVFTDEAIKNTWLEVTVRGNDARGGFHTNTALDKSSVFYFGSRVGDTFIGNAAASAGTTSADSLQIRAAGGTFAASGNRYDINRDGLVSAADELLARANIGLLRMLDLPRLGALSADAAAKAIAAPKADPLLSAVVSALGRAGSIEPNAAGSVLPSGSVRDATATESQPPRRVTKLTGDVFSNGKLSTLVVDEIVAEDLKGDEFLLDALLS